MDFEKDLEWFTKDIAPSMSSYEIEYRFFEQGDFGELNQVEFNSELKGGNIDFWGLGWIGIHLVDYISGDEIMNVLLEPTERENINFNLNKLISLL